MLQRISICGRGYCDCISPCAIVRHVENQLAHKVLIERHPQRHKYSCGGSCLILGAIKVEIISYFTLSVKGRLIFHYS